MAEREGFEPPIPLRVCRISSAVLSTTQPPLQIWGRARARNLATMPRLRKCDGAPISPLWRKLRPSSRIGRFFLLPRWNQRRGRPFSAMWSRPPAWTGIGGDMMRTGRDRRVFGGPRHPGAGSTVAGMASFRARPAACRASLNKILAKISALVARLGQVDVYTQYVYGPATGARLVADSHAFRLNACGAAAFMRMGSPMAWQDTNLRSKNEKRVAVWSRTFSSGLI